MSALQSGTDRTSSLEADGYSGTMRVLWLAAEYERVCRDCGWSWRVPRSVAWRRGRPVPGDAGGLGRALRISRADSAGTACMGKPARLRAEAAPFAAASRVVRELRSCPRCSSGRFLQRPFWPGSQV
jgi:hypothetical protein